MSMQETLRHLELRNVTKRYGPSYEAIKSVDFSVNAGEFIVLLGPSGCGKSTLLRMIAGLESITTGELWIDGRSVADTHPRDRDIAMVFQNYALYPHMSVSANLEYPLKLRGMPRAERQARVREIAEMLELGEYLGRKPAELSGGQRQRVAMGRALVRKPALFLMDEPLSNLDARLRMQMRVDIAQLQKRLGVTTVYVTHDQIEAMTMADRIVVMSQGLVQQIGRPYDVYLTPANLFVAGFIGAPPMNLMSGADLPSALQALSMSARPDDTIIGIRPEDIEIGSTETPGIAVSGRIFAVEALGSDSLCHVRIGQSGVNGSTGSTSLVMRRNGNAEALRDTDVRLHFPHSALHVFDAGSGQRISGDRQQAA